MLILAIETSCDDTCCAVMEINPDQGSQEILANCVSSQVEIHKKYGGIVPRLAARAHTENIRPVFDKTLEEAGKDIKDMDLIAITCGPGLIPSLLVGASFAKALAWKYDLPIIGVNHLEGHLYSNFVQISNIQYPVSNNLPAICLIASGGHTMLVLMEDLGKFQVLGQTLDDACGEAFDKVARLLGLGYPGGPAIEKRAKTGDSQKFSFPRPMIRSGDYNFSFSGLKTAVYYRIQDLGSKIQDEDVINDMAASFQGAVIDVLTVKTIRAAKNYNVKTIMLSGGVAANKALRTRLRSMVKSQWSKVNLLAPPEKFCTDNGAMVALAGYYDWKKMSKKQREALTWENVRADPNLTID